jgi:hypothetical protein
MIDKKEQRPAKNNLEDCPHAEPGAMSLEEIVHRVESRLFVLGRVMIQADAASDMSEELDLLQAERSRLAAELERAQARQEELKRELADKEALAALLPSQIESSFRRGKASQAMRQALELDRLRKDIQAGQTGLPRLEQACWCLEFRLRQLERRCRRLQEAIDRK